MNSAEIGPQGQLSRRNLLRFGLAGLAAGVGGVGVDVLSWLGKIESSYHELLISERTITDARITRPYYFVHTSDLHFAVGGRHEAFIDPEATRSIVAATNNRVAVIKEHTPEATIISVNTGDHIIFSDGMQTDNLTRGLQELAQIDADEHIAVLGNHDHYGNCGELVVDALKTAGFTVLAADTAYSRISLPGLDIIGTADHITFPQVYIEADARLRDAVWRPIFADGIPKVWITHSAQPIDRLGFGNIVRRDTIASFHGHTHGGQFGNSALFGPTVNVHALHAINYKSKYIDGLYQVGNGYYVNVNTGLGSIADPYLQELKFRAIPPRVDIIGILPSSYSAPRNQASIYTYR